jgi:hypothetical protein
MSAGWSLCGKADIDSHHRRQLAAKLDLDPPPFRRQFLRGNVVGFKVEEDFVPRPELQRVIEVEGAIDPRPARPSSVTTIGGKCAYTPGVDMRVPTIALARRGAAAARARRLVGKGGRGVPGAKRAQSAKDGRLSDPIHPLPSAQIAPAPVLGHSRQVGPLPKAHAGALIFRGAPTARKPSDQRRRPWVIDTVVPCGFRTTSTKVKLIGACLALL